MIKEQIGLATLYLGDSREAPLADGCADIIFTDPPYGHNNNNGDLIHRREAALGKKCATPAESRPIANDDAASTDAVVRWLFKESPRLLSPGGCCCCCCGGGGPDPQFARWTLYMDESMAFKQQVIWDKGKIGMGWHYRRSVECVLVASKRGCKPRWYDDSHRVENVIRPGDYGIKKIIPRATDHPTPKPPALAAHFIKLHSAFGHTVLDPFMGAGSTGVAAVKMGRLFTGVELEPRWFDLACERIAEAQRPSEFIPL